MRVYYRIKKANKKMDKTKDNILLKKASSNKLKLKRLFLRQLINSLIVSLYDFFQPIVVSKKFCQG